MVIKLSLELGVLVESSQEKDVQNPRQKGKVKGRGRGPRQFGEACMTFFHVAGAVGDRDTTCHCSTTLGERSDVFFPSQKSGHDFGVRYVPDWPFGMGTTPGMGDLQSP